MRNLTFRGSANDRKRGFDPFRPPDFTQQITQNAERTLSGMRDVQNQHRENRRDILQYTRDKFEKEERQRDKNFSLKRSFDDAYHDAEMQHYKQAIADEAVKAHDAQRKHQDLKKLVDLIPQTISSLNQFDAARKASAEKKMFSLFTSLPAEAKNNLIPILERTQKIDYAVATTQERYGLDSQEWSQLQNLKGHNKIAIQTLAAQRDIENNFPRFYSEAKVNEKYKVGDSTLIEILQSKDVKSNAEFNTLVDSITEDYLLERYKGKFSTDFIATYARPHIDKFIGGEKAEFQATLKNNRKNFALNEQWEGVQRHISAEPNQNFPQGIWNYIKSTPDFANNHETVSRVLAHLADKGEITQSQLEQLQKFVIPDGPNKGKTYGAAHAKHLRPAFKNAGQYAARDEALYEQGKIAKLNEAGQQLLQIELKEGRPANAAEKERSLNWLFANGVKQADIDARPSIFKSKYQQRHIEIEKAEQALQAKYKAGTLSMIDLQKYHPSLHAKYSKLALDGPSGISKKQSTLQFGRIASTLKTIAGEEGIDTENASSETKAMISIATERIQDDMIHTLMTEGLGQSPVATLRDMITGEINLIKNREGIYARNLNKKGQEIKGKGSGWQYAGATGLELTGEYTKAMRDDTASITRPGFLSEKHLEQLVDYRNGQRSQKPWFLPLLDRLEPNKSEAEIAADLIEAETGKRIQFKGHERFIEVVPRDKRKLLTDRTSQAKTLTAFSGTPEDFDAVIRSHIPKDKFNYHPDDPFDVINSPFSGNGMDLGINILPAGLANTQIGALLQLGNQNRVTNFGAYGFSTKELKRFVDSGFVSTTDTFTPELQTLLKAEQIYQDNSVIYADEDMLQPIPGIGQAWGNIIKNSFDQDVDTDTALALGEFLDFTKIHPEIYDEVMTLTYIK